MKNRLLSYLFFSLAAGFQMMSLAAAAPAVVPVVASDLLTLRKSCELLAEKPRDEEALAALLEYAKNTNGIDRLRSRAMAGYALSSLFKGDTNLYVCARQSHVRAYPDDQHLLRIDPKTCYVTCEECKGSGVTGETGGRCPKCKGNPESFVTPTKVYDDFTLIVKGITKWINNEDVFYQHYQAAKGKENIDERVAAFKELLANYSYREEKAEVEKLLTADLEVLKERTKAQKEQMEKERREITLLRALKDSVNPAAAIATLNDYLERHPDSEHRLELLSMVNNMAADLKRHNIKRRNLYVVGGIILLIFAVSCVLIHHYNYNIFSHHKDVEEKETE